MTNHPAIKRGSPKVRSGTCMACGGDGGTLVVDYVDEEDEYYPFKFLNCPCCDGEGQRCLRCWPQPTK